ncbi:ATP-binding protein [Pseudonocardia endophytica]|uniref:Anti-sigma regulatory factor (Ser/Thr protein kinase) n=1 Tax=Pseudonocardia endophytica TaxID=401976 RepID=A0A4R1HG07_PSEEN|nr:ATP-binding protein [Pseudonocardia endophytica]TCK20618.1 anti-sigma regulatory factor (Ser/Thr protein kinase) [Pseudonocardia endophytica]
MCSGKESCLFLLDPMPGADRPAREHLRPWLVEQGLVEDEVHDVLTAVTEAVCGVTNAERREGRGEPVQVSAVIEADTYGALGVALRVVDQGTMPLARGTVSHLVDYGQTMMRAAMDEVTTTSDPHGGTVIAMRTRPLLRRRPGTAC